MKPKPEHEKLAREIVHMYYQLEGDLVGLGNALTHNFAKALADLEEKTIRKCAEIITKHEQRYREQHSTKEAIALLPVKEEILALLDEEKK
jgi:hypothetical protein